MTRLRQDTGGAAYVEFLLSFIPVFIMFLGMLQAALLYGANLVVSHAATTAARAAVVVLPDNPDEYGGEGVNNVSFAASGGSSSDASECVISELGSLGGVPIVADTSGSARLNAIRAAASIPLLAVSPSFEQLVGDAQVYTAVGGNPGARAAVGGLLYNKTAVSVTFPTAPGASSFRTSFTRDENITVRVTYLFHCGIPLANWYMCDDYASLRSGIPMAALRDLARRSGSSTSDPNEIAELVRRVRHSRERLVRARPGMDELSQSQVPWLGYLTALTGSRFVVLRAEATMRNQGASYTYE